MSDYRINDAGYMQHRFDPTRYEHRDVWIAANGPIPSDHHIHHKNKIRTDNRLDNLECMEKEAHLKLHGLTFKMINSWAAKKARTIPRQVDCIVCDKVFETWHWRAKYCSNTCRTKYLNWLHWIAKVAPREKELTQRKCPTCERDFIPQDYRMVKFCAPRCTQVFYSRKNAASRGHTPTPSLYRADLANV